MHQESDVGIRIGRRGSLRPISSKAARVCSGSLSRSSTQRLRQYRELTAVSQRVESTQYTGTPHRPRLRAMPTPPWCPDPSITTGVEQSAGLFIARPSLAAAVEEEPAPSTESCEPRRCEPQKRRVDRRCAPG